MDNSASFYNEDVEIISVRAPILVRLPFVRPTPSIVASQTRTSTKPES